MTQTNTERRNFFLRRLASIEKLVIINVERVIDHTIRLFSGLPTMKRSKITPNIFLGGQYNAEGLKRLHTLGITSVVNMRTTSFQANAEKAGITYLQLPTRDLHAPSMAHLKKGVQFIDRVVRAKGKVYVHCRAGEGRGPTMVIAYLIKTGLTLTDALLQVQKIRRFAKPTRDQMKRLEEFEKKCL